jgi:hypothetical protein
MSFNELLYWTFPAPGKMFRPQTKQKSINLNYFKTVMSLRSHHKGLEAIDYRDIFALPKRILHSLPFLRNHFLRIPNG